MARQRAEPVISDFLEAFGDVSTAVESGAGLPEVARATSRALDASVAIVDSATSVLAVACRSPEDERLVLSLREGSEVHELRVADSSVGELRYRPRGEPPPAALLRMVGALIALEVERSRGPARAAEASIASFVEDLLRRRVTDRDNIVARAQELGADLTAGASVIVARARPHAPEEGDWRARLLSIVERGARPAASGALAALVDLTRGGGGHDGTLAVLVPGSDVPAVCDASSRPTSSATATRWDAAAQRLIPPICTARAPRHCWRQTSRRHRARRRSRSRRRGPTGCCCRR
jgi:hypothetical protein